MNPELTLDSIRPVMVLSDWAKTLLSSARESIYRMDSALTRAEAKVAYLRYLRARRREEQEKRQASLEEAVAS